ncbi:flavin reductase family protein [Nocardia sp. XZ_19_385]|uniref:flavin reductase family protein n=1 Tax=Nocardia sp. XZ_19_385 TaxID=2769488 RepID=UPI0018901731|nr:flavin reductase family protein [Nocardia sp. XZ_19_385]
MAEETLRAFDAVVARANPPVWVVTVVAGEQRAGCLVGFASQVSIEPRQFLVGLSTANHTFDIAGGAKYLAVHLLDGADTALAQLFGGETGTDLDKFDHCEWTPGPHGLPILTGAAGWFTGAIIERIEFGDHVGHLLTPTAASAPPEDRSGLHYRSVAEIEPGHEAG